MINNETCVTKSEVSNWGNLKSESKPKTVQGKQKIYISVLKVINNETYVTKNTVSGWGNLKNKTQFKKSRKHILYVFRFAPILKKLINKNT